ncbi:hypothetical protein FHS55_000566 [Angulomicrobium tetraedrale]|uniref:Uncharacterized protein n=1 Tax=Ancylobacter tetraedralis TaxID=217068 RepID=A0A839Z5Z6_9HYPH|nr:hypothetical protein [Ancylobacter tetraedralis]MBB3769980.1 hypothetical protein [Ancylobacter tetraedralis]
MSKTGCKGVSWKPRPILQHGEAAEDELKLADAGARDIFAATGRPVGQAGRLGEVGGDALRLAALEPVDEVGRIASDNPIRPRSNIQCAVPDRANPLMTI